MGFGDHSFFMQFCHNGQKVLHNTFKSLTKSFQSPTVSQKHFLKDMYFQVLSVITAGSSVQHFERQSCTGCQQPLSVLAGTLLLILIHTDPALHCSLWGLVLMCAESSSCVCRLLLRRCGNVCTCFCLSVFSFLNIFVVSRLKKQRHNK